MLDTYKPIVWEYSRLNVTNNVMSKRKLNKLVTGACLLAEKVCKHVDAAVS